MRRGPGGDLGDRLRSAAPLAALVALAGAGTLLVVSATGLLGGRSAPEPPPGSIAVPIAALPIPAYARIELEHLIDPARGTLAVAYLPAGSILPDTVTRPEDVIGRVLAFEKPAGRLFTRADFLPEGTRPGLVAGIPPGKRAVRVDAAQVNGLVGLRAGDRFDLVATWRGGPARGAAASGAMPGPLGDPRSRAAVRTLVADGVVVKPLETRSVPRASAGAVVQEVVLAVEAAEVAPLTEALAAGARIDCLPRSGRPEEGDAPVDAMPGTPPGGPGDVHYVESIRGTERRWIAVPREGAPPRGAVGLDPLGEAARAAALEP